MKIYLTGLIWLAVTLPQMAGAWPRLVISEFMAVNQKTVQDADGDYSPWIEIYNPTTEYCSLKGWSLTDDTNNLRQWQFPDVTLLDAGRANESDNFMVVFASGKDRTNNTAELHTNFRLPATGGYLALVDPNTNIVAVFDAYPAQQADVSYGLDAADFSAIGYFANPTPGKPNAMSGATAAPTVTFSRAGGTFATPFSVELSAPPGAVIYYSTNGTVPTQISLLYQSSISVTQSQQIRARAFVPGLMPGAIHSETYLQLDAGPVGLTGRRSDLPAVVIYNFGAGSVLEASKQMANISIYEPQGGVTFLTNAPTLTARAGIHLHGSSTLMSPKQSYAVDFWDELNNDFDCTPLGLPAESDFILYGPDSWEPVLMHNPLIYQLSNDIGRYAPRTRFVEVYINTTGGPVKAADYNGIYVLEEKIKWGPNRVNVPKVHSVDALHPTDNSEPNVTGGYIAKVDDLNVGETGFTVDGQIHAYDYPNELEMKTPQRAPQKQYLQSYLDNFSEALNGENYTDPVLGYRPFIDVPSWIDYHLLNVVAFNEDTLNASAYYYKGRNDVLRYGPIWDFDRSQGSRVGPDFNPNVWGQEGTDMFRKYWWGRVFTDIDFWQAWIDRYEDLRETTFSTNHIYSVIDTFAAQVRGEDDREVARWDFRPRIGTVTMYDYSYDFPGTYNGEVSFLKQWYADRLHFLDTNFLAKPVFSDTNGAILSDSSPLQMTAEAGATVYYTTDGSDPRLPGGDFSPSAQIYAGPVLLTTIVTFKARAFNPLHFNMQGSNNPPVSSPWSGLASETFKVAAPPAILQSPTDLEAYIGQSLAFTVQADATPAPYYQWAFNGVELEGQTNAQLILTATSTNQTGVYSVLVTNLAGSDSASFILTITPKPNLVITEVMSSEAKAKTAIVTSDWWELSNLGNFPVNLRGYRFDDNHNSLADAFTIPDEMTIGPGESIILVEDMAPYDFRAWWGEENLPESLQIITYPSIGFSSSGDEIHLWNAAATSETDTVASATYPVASKGDSFGFDPLSKTFGPLSVAGRNGAFVAAVDGDIGSPGKVIITPDLVRADYDSEAGFNVQISTLPNLNYVIEYKNSLVDAEWTTLSNFTATSNTFLLIDSTAGTNASRFYRVGVTP
jgi:CotH protein/chitobiase/beta-hexosaminidase-like protein/lamin tail-like protein/Ig-like domain-containing protein